MIALRWIFEHAGGGKMRSWRRHPGSTRNRTSRRSTLFSTVRALAAALAGGIAFSDGAEPPPRSPVSGDIAGSFRWLEVPGSPAVQTRVEVGLNAMGQLEITISAHGDGVALAAVVSLPKEGSDGSWKITRGEIDLAVWERFVAARFAGKVLPADLETQGKVQLTGEGKWKDRVFLGLLSADLKNGHAGSVAQTWSASGLDLHTVLELKAGGIELRNSRVTAESVEVASISGQNLVITVLGREGGEWTVEEATVKTLGGVVAIEPFVFLPSKPALDLVIGLKGLDLSQVATLVPQALTRAGGHLSGRVGLRWSAETGFAPKQGSLRLDATEGATLQLANAPGFLSSRVPSKINLVPTWTGPLAKMLAQDSPAYVALREIESGSVPLKVEKLEIDLYPDGPEALRSAQINVTARPASGNAVKTVRFNVTVSGPLDEVLKLGLDHRVGLSVKKSP